ncbi:hypothetical protein VIBNISO65_1270015 [Vibrio nigripulchritudo SO65]|uniref:hypothetical protein n=1 Tax=Vibrio nigripulchritudo TaxID=28173 RepID=UPI0003B1B735|nr:hypothetical protein [Vibrio nigripulchritudo]CCN35988.1 hypothetical protein VIBNIAM115_200029 [Vibrio nigripulchritudo AM115]CCN44215.1 hypothetical protein VIBNIFTn2_720031 [Vibrio nigripulchritudo FTn2]CCN64575.1 hypothetical protein VIBNIPon4_230015 [Vibrio nigripulchritudo POn4]CCN75061.1 hypothetical protein VIBNISO65_1270015 [Vibrio nigripulchritudo SO65]
MSSVTNLAFSADQIVELAKVFTWPLTTIVLALLFKSKLASVLDSFMTKNSVTELSTPAFTAKFSQVNPASEPSNERHSIEISADYESVVKNQNENESKYTRALLKNYQLHRKSYNLSDAEALTMAEKNLSITVAQNWYAGINRIIYKSQWVLLDYMYAQIDKKVSFEYMSSQFVSTKSVTQELEHATRELYVNYLINQGLIQVSGDDYKLTDMGESYVEFMKKYPNLVTSLDPR